MVVKGASRCCFEQIFGWTKKLNEGPWVGQQKNTSREWTECFFWIIPSYDATRKKGSWDGKSGKCPRFSAELFWETKTSHSKKKMCKSLGFLQTTPIASWPTLRKIPMENHPFLWYVSVILVICHSYVSLQEWLRKRNCHQTLTALAIGHAEPQVWQDLEKAWKIDGGRFHHSRRKKNR